MRRVTHEHVISSLSLSRPLSRFVSLLLSLSNRKSVHRLRRGTGERERQRVTTLFLFLSHWFDDNISFDLDGEREEKFQLDISHDRR